MSPPVYPEPPESPGTPADVAPAQDWERRLDRLWVEWCYDCYVDCDGDLQAECLARFERGGER